MNAKDRIDWGAIDRRMENPEEDFVILAKAANLDPKFDFMRQDLRNIDFGDCDLTGFNFSGANIAGCDFSKAKIDGACFDNVKGRDTAKFPK